MKGVESMFVVDKGNNGCPLGNVEEKRGEYLF